MTTLTYRAYRFGEFRLDQATRELHKGEQVLQLSPRLLDALFYLIERRGYTVDRHELAKVIWGHAHLSQSALGQVIRQLRQTLGDNGDDQHVIKTVRGFGYRWIAPIEASNPAIA